MRPILVLFVVLLVAVPVLAWPGFGSVDTLSQVVVVLNGSGYGTGWWASPRHVVTAEHVVAGLDTVTVMRGDWRSTARVVYSDPQTDVAVLLVENPPGWAEGLPLSRKIFVGQKIAVVGYPIEVYYQVNQDLKAMSIAPRMAYGHIAWIAPDKPVAEIDVPTDAGNSGGPVVDEDGAVVGIVSHALMGVASTGYYITTSDAVRDALVKVGVEPRYADGFNWPLFAAGAGAAVALLLVALVRGGRIG